MLLQSGGVLTYFGGNIPQWFSIDLGEHRSLCATGFALRHGYNAANSYARNFKLEASHTGITWYTVKDVPGNPFQGAFDEKSWTFAGQTRTSFRFPLSSFFISC